MQNLHIVTALMFKNTVRAGNKIVDTKKKLDLSRFMTIIDINQINRS